MDISYIREPRASYMKIKATESCNVNQMRMAVENSIEHLLPVSCRVVNDEQYYLYNITAQISMAEEYENHELNYTELINLVNAIKNVLASLERYFLKPSDIIFEPELMYISADRKNYEFCIYCGKDKNYDVEIKELFEYIIKKVNHKDSLAVTTAYGIYKRIMLGVTNPMELFELEETEATEKCCITTETLPIKEIVPEIITEEQEITDYSGLIKTYLPAVVAIVSGIIGIVVMCATRNFLAGGIGFLIAAVAGYCSYRKGNEHKGCFSKIITVKKRIPYERQSVKISVPKKVEEENLTVILSDKLESNAHYLKINNPDGCRKYTVSDKSMIIGSSKDRADCVIEEEGISRTHARISKEGNAFYIKDLNSRNGTYVNGRQLACFEMCEIKKNDVIIFGNVECVFI